MNDRIVVTDEVRFAKEVADRVVFMDNGEFVRQFLLKIFSNLRKSEWDDTVWAEILLRQTK